MKKLLLAAVALGGLTALIAPAATASPAAAGVHVAPSHSGVTQINYYWHRRHWHHRRWEHHRWRYWN